MAYTPEQLSDMQCIREAALRYCRGVDRLDGRVRRRQQIVPLLCVVKGKVEE